MQQHDLFTPYSVAFLRQGDASGSLTLGERTSKGCTFLASCKGLPGRTWLCRLLRAIRLLGCVHEAWNWLSYDVSPQHTPHESNEVTQRLEEATLGKAPKTTAVRQLPPPSAREFEARPHACGLTSLFTACGQRTVMNRLTSKETATWLSG